MEQMLKTIGKSAVDVLSNDGTDVAAEVLPVLAERLTQAGNSAQEVAKMSKPLQGVIEKATQMLGPKRFRRAMAVGNVWARVMMGVLSASSASAQDTSQLFKMLEKADGTRIERVQSQAKENAATLGEVKPEQTEEFIREISACVSDIDAQLREISTPDELQQIDELGVKRYLWSHLFLSNDNRITRGNYDLDPKFWEELRKVLKLKNGEEINMSDFLEKEAELREGYPDTQEGETAWRNSDYYKQCEKLVSKVQQLPSFLKLLDVCEDPKTIYWMDLHLNPNTPDELRKTATAKIKSLSNEELAKVISMIDWRA